MRYIYSRLGIFYIDNINHRLSRKFPIYNTVDNMLMEDK